MTQAPEQSTARGWMPDDSTFGARLALIRQYMKWGNVKEAAIECGIPPESWRTWERDGVEPRRIVEISALISDRTGCDYGWLLAGPRLQGGSLREPYVPTTRSVDPLKARPVSGGPFSGGRRDSTRPVSSVPAARRRPRVVSTQRRPKAA